MLNPTSKKCLFLLGILHCTDKETLSKYGIGRRTLANLISDKLIKKDKLIINNNSYTIYYLTGSGIKLFKKHYRNYDIGNSCSMVHDYIHSKNVLSFITSFDDLYSYTNEKAIRKKYKEKITLCEIEKGISIGCPDCSLIIEGKEVFIETLVTNGKDKSIKKENFKYVIEDDNELIIFKF